MVFSVSANRYLFLKLIPVDTRNREAIPRVLYRAVQLRR